jgi:anti-anti-sigma factor
MMPRRTRQERSIVDHLMIECRQTDTARILALHGELDLASVTELVDRAEAALREGGPLVLDLRGLRFIDSTGLGAVARIDRAARRAGTNLALVAGPANVQRVFEISGMVDALTWTAEDSRD